MTNYKILLLLLTYLCCAQAQEASPLSFEVATIRGTDPTNPTPPAIRYLGSRLQITNMTLQELISIDYDLNFASKQRVIGGPGWMQSERFDVIAKEDEVLMKRLHDLPTSEQGDANRQLIRALLTERFGLKAHQEQRILTTYILEVAKDGPKLSSGILDAHLSSSIPQSRVNMMGIGWMQAHNTDMTLFAKVIGSQAELNGRTVVDKTGLKGRYDFTLRWAPATLAENEDTDPSPSLFSALQKQLGLRLTTKKNTVDVLLVDSVEKPSPN
jgi:uncharacterized protein (TIGR03435 family)